MQMKTRIYVADTDALENRELFASKLLCVSPERRAAIEKYRFEKDKRLSLGAGLLFNLALSDLNIDPSAVSVKKGEHGKPYLIEYPGVFFNLSHSGSRAMCVISDRECGCDVEKISGEHMSVAEHFFTGPEQEYIAKGTEGDAGRFFRLWTHKESYIKATGAGLSALKDRFSFSFSEKGAEMTPEGEACRFFEPRLNDCYSYACCIRGDSDEEPEVIIADLSCL